MIKSLCTIATRSNLEELLLMIYSFRLFHDEKSCSIYVLCDHETTDAIFGSENVLGLLNCTNMMGVYFNSSLPTYDPSDDNGWVNLMLTKTNVMDFALHDHGETLFVDSDLIFLAPITDLSFDACEVILSPHRILKTEEAKHGTYNGGFVATNRADFPQWWRDATAKNPKFFEQYCLNDASEDYEVKVAPPWHNFGWFRVSPWHQENYTQNLNRMGIDDDEHLCYDGVKISSVHTHLTQKEARFQVLNRLLISLFEQTSNSKYKAIGNYAKSLGLIPSVPVGTS